MKMTHTRNHCKLPSTPARVLTTRTVASSVPPMSTNQFNFKGIHLNVQGMSNKIGNLEILLKTEKTLFLLVTEHWMSSEQAEVTTIPGYYLLSHYCRSSAIHGGAAIYGRDDVTNVNPIKGIKQLSSDFICECSGITIKYKNSKIALLAIYRSPNAAFDLFLNLLNSIICLVSKSHNYIIIGGDFNVNSLTDSNSKSLLFDLFDNFDLISTLPTEPTRDFNNSKSAIDYVISNIPDIKSINLDLNISDHKAQLFTTNFPDLPENVKNKPLHIFKRNFTEQNLSNLYNLLSKTDLSNLFTTKDPNQAWEIFWQNLLYCLDLACPLIKVTIPQNTIKNNWVDASIVKESETLKNLYWLSKNTGNPAIKDYYQQNKKAFAEKIEVKKKSFYQKKLNDTSNFSREIWNIVNENVGRIKKSTDISCINHKENLIYDNYEISNSFCKYYCQIANQLINDTYSNPSQNCTVGEMCNSSLYFYDISPNEILLTLNSMQNKKSSGPDNITIKALKYISRFLIYPLCYIFNLCIKTGIFPDKLKFALIVPLHKKGDVELIENYRPIVLLSCFSKLFEKIIQNRILKFINSHKLLSQHQHGFRSNHSTNTAAFDFTNFIYTAVDNKELTVALFFDLTRAFDCVDSNFMSKKLEALGIRGHLNKWIFSFLTNRKIAVKVNNIISDSHNLNLGVPQGSVLSPLLFILFINDLESYISKEINAFLTMFADDTTICVTATSLKTLELNANKLLALFYDWCSSNNLIINASKTNYILFHNRNIDPQNFTLQLNTTTLGKVSSTKFLGLYIDQGLSWVNHIDHVLSKLRSAYYVIRNLKPIMDVKYLLNIYYSLAYSHIKYLILYWGQATDINRVFVQQKRILRLIYAYHPLESCRPLFKNNNILTVSSVLIFEACLFVKNNLDLFPLQNNIHDHQTRSAQQIHINNFRLSLYKKSAHYTCSAIYNKLPQHIKTANSFRNFKKLLHAFLSTNCFYTLKEFFDYNM